MTLPIGGADMPVVISLLNSYSGVAGRCCRFSWWAASLLIVAGAMVGAAGLILTQVMCNGMNRSLGSVLFGGAWVPRPLQAVAAVNTPTSPAAVLRSALSPLRPLNGW